MIPSGRKTVIIKQSGILLKVNDGVYAQKTVALIP
jgi:hypothetical protein